VQDPALVLEGSVKALLYASLLVAIGANTARWLLFPRVAAELGADGVAALERSVARIACAACFLTLAACVLRVWTHTVAAFGFDGAGSWDTIELIALHSRWGKGWKPQMIAALVLAVAGAASVWRRKSWPLATFAVIVFTATMPLLGHASGNAGLMAVDAIHILGGGVWLGTLAAVLLTPIRPARIRLLILRRFSPIALAGAAAVMGTGLIAAWSYIGAVSNLWTTAYGCLLVIKAGLAGAIVVCGYTNWQRLRKLHGKSAPTATIIVLETMLALAVVIVTGYLTEIAHP
jgi:putative copper export protein